MTPDLDDYDGIVAAVQAYIDGWNERDPKKFKRAFHEDVLAPSKPSGEPAAVLLTPVLMNRSPRHLSLARAGAVSRVRVG
jgi:hypothetical protein